MGDGDISWSPDEAGASDAASGDSRGAGIISWPPGDAAAGAADAASGAAGGAAGAVVKPVENDERGA